MKANPAPPGCSMCRMRKKLRPPPLLTVLQPLRKGVAPRPVSYNDNRLVVGVDTFLLNNGTIECGGQKVPCFH